MNKKSTLLRLLKYLLRYKFLLLGALLLTLASNLLGLVGPKLSGYAIDAIGIEAGKVDFPSVFYYCGLMVAFYLASALLSYLLSILMIYISRRVVHRMRSDIFNKLMSLPVGFFDNNQTGDILSRISYDTDTINTSLSHDVIHILASVITIVGSFVMMVTISPVLVLVFVVTIPLSIFLTKFIATRTKPLFRARSKKLGELNGFVEEMISGQKTLKAYCQEENTIDSMEAVNREAVEAFYKAEYYGSTMGPSVNFINNLSLTLVSVFGAFLYMGGALSVGNISSFVLYSRRFSGPINEIANIYGDLQSAMSAAERVFRLLDELPEPPDAPGTPQLTDVQGDVEFRDVSFGYVPDRTVLKNLSLFAPKGSLIAIVGPTGAGKTTLINLLMRFYDAQSGSITVDEKSIYDVTRKSLRSTYSMVLQDTWLFEGTIAENIAYSRPSATMEEIVAAAKAANIDSYIRHLPQGYDTVLTDNGTNISKGQKQLLTIARAMLMDTPMLILDEATSNVDTRTEVEIQQAMRKLMKDKTCFVVAHRLSTIQNADQILVVRDGNVVESGTHKELMAAKGFYRELYDSQFR